MTAVLYRVAAGLITIFALGACAQLGAMSASAGATGPQSGTTSDFDPVSNSARNPGAIYQGRGD
jgi:hypothetical protein